MLEELADRVAGFVADHDLLTIVCLLVLTAGVAAGLPQLNIADQTAIDDSVFDATEVGAALTYMENNYSTGGERATATSSVYVRPESGNALSRSSLLAALDYQQTVLNESAVERELVGERIRGPPTLVGRHLAGPNASIADQRAAISKASDADLRAAIEATLSDRDRAVRYLPGSYEPGTASAESMRVQFVFRQASVTQQQQPRPAEDAQRVLYETAQDRPSMFTAGAIAQAGWEETQITDVFWLIIPPALVLVVLVLAFAYRDLVDVVLGFLGVSVSVLWFFGILGWLGIPAGFATIVGPVLIVALSIDFGLHVFMRHREQRGPDEGIRAPMARSTASVLVAFLLVAVTAAVGFLANVTSPIGFIRAFGVVITLGVFASALIFVTLVPALKVRADETLEWLGLDRRKTALGTTGRLKPLLSTGVDVARRAGPVVVVGTVLVGALGLVAFTQVERQGFQQDFASESDWQTDLPDPVGWSAHETAYRQHRTYIETNYQSDVARDRRTALLIRGPVNDTTALERLHAGERAARESDAAFRQGGAVRTISVLTLIRNGTVESEQFAALVNAVAAENEAFDALLSELAAENEQFGTALERAPESGRDVEGTVTELYDALYAVAPDRTAEVLERRNGSYRSMRLLVPVRQGLDVDEQGAAMHAIADATAGDSDLRVVPVGFATVSNAGLGAIADGILQTMLLAFVGIALVLAGVYRIERDSALLGAITVVPIVLVVGLVFAGMWLFGVPLTFVTAFLVSITIGLGIDYNIHVSDRFAQELAGETPVDALYATVRGTGGALFGSALTSGAAFGTLLLHPSAVFSSFGFIVVVALVLSFVVSVLVFPSLLLWWGRRR
jgi:predicted RND superfamily exporter protein